MGRRLEVDSFEKKKKFTLSVWDWRFTFSYCIEKILGMLESSDCVGLIGKAAGVG